VNTPPACLRREDRSTKKKPRKTRAARKGEVEAIALHERLVQLVSGEDVLARALLRDGLGAASGAVRAYAATLLEDGAHSDAIFAKALGVGPRDVAEARAAQATLLDRIAEK
jgi:hypothetical protein